MKSELIKIEEICKSIKIKNLSNFSAVKSVDLRSIKNVKNNVKESKFIPELKNFCYEVKNFKG